LKQPEDVTPDDIPRLFSRLEDVGKKPLMDTGLRKPGWPVATIYYGIAAVASLFVGLGLWRWRRRHSG
jgi:hypothetical protein